MMVTDDTVVSGPDNPVAQAIVAVSEGMVVVIRMRNPVGLVVIDHSRGPCRSVTVGGSCTRSVRGSGAGSGVNHRCVLFRSDFLSRHPCTAGSQNSALTLSDARRAPDNCPSLMQRARCCGLSASDICCRGGRSLTIEDRPADTQIGSAVGACGADSAATETGFCRRRNGRRSPADRAAYARGPGRRRTDARSPA